MRRVLLFGTFDPLHEGHRALFRRAKAQGEQLLVVVARDETIRRFKQREPVQSEEARLAAVQREPIVDEAQLGDDHPEHYRLLTTLDFDTLVLGYDQTPTNDEVKRLVRAAGKAHVKLIRLPPYQPDQYKSSRLRHD